MCVKSVKFKTKQAASSIPFMQYGFYRFIIAINHFNDDDNIDTDEDINNQQAHGDMLIRYQAAHHYLEILSILDIFFIPESL